MHTHAHDFGLAGAAIDSAGETTYRAIRRDIILGRLAPRARLRLERLKSDYGASINTLRESLNRLTGEGFVVIEGQRGFAVAPVTQTEFQDLAALRLLLEGHAIRKSFARGDLDWEGRVVGAHHKLDRIETRLLTGEAVDSELWKRCDKEFHHMLISACGSAELVEAHGSVFDRYLRYQIIAVIFRGAPAAQEHRALLDAALDRDADGAIAILQRHVQECVAHTLRQGGLDAIGAAGRPVRQGRAA